MSDTSDNTTQEAQIKSKKVAARTKIQKMKPKKRNIRLKFESDDESSSTGSAMSITEESSGHEDNATSKTNSTSDLNDKVLSETAPSDLSMSPTPTSSKGSKKKSEKKIKAAKASNSKNTPTPENIVTKKPEITNLSPQQEESESTNEPSTCPILEESVYNRIKNRMQFLKLYAPDTGPKMYNPQGNMVTPPLITQRLPRAFQFLPVYGRPEPNQSLEDFYRNKVREYVGGGLNDEEFEDLEAYCSPEHLKTGNELKMQASAPGMGLLNSNIRQDSPSTQSEETSDASELVILKRNKIRMEVDVKGLLTKKLKYRGVRILPFAQEESDESTPSEEKKRLACGSDADLEPGVDILYKVRIYRPYTYSMNKDRFTRSRNSVFCCDALLTGRHKLTALRERFVCHNDFDIRVDVSEHPDAVPTARAQEMFPSGFLFINNVFYVDTRDGCIDYSAPIREWAIKKKLGDFPKKDMCQVKLQDLILRLGYPEVYVHQGNCEHVFLFSEVRLLNADDPLRFSNYPCSTAIAQNQTVYCTTCAEFSAKWIVVGSDRIPFDPAFFCDQCFRQYLYKDGKKIDNFKAYRYRGNALNVLKPH